MSLKTKYSHVIEQLSKELSNLINEKEVAEKKLFTAQNRGITANKWTLKADEIINTRNSIDKIESDISLIYRKQSAWRELFLAEEQGWKKLSIPLPYFGEEIAIAVCELSSLEKLKLGDEFFRWQVLPPQIKKLVNLVELDISSNNLKVLPKEIGDLRHLKILNLAHNELSELPPEIKSLKFLENLILSYNSLNKLPKEFGSLKKLNSCNINFNQLTSLPVEIGMLENLKTFAVISNNLASIPPEIGNLQYLTYLHFGGNQLTTLPPEIGRLENLETFILVKNKISNLPNEIENLKQLKYLNLEANPLYIPPEVILKKSEPNVILNYYFALVKATTKKALNEIKLLIVGEGSVGKTSLVEQFLYNTFHNNQIKTEGISIKQWTVASLAANQSSIKLNVWDFGGQEIMHATHQFFLTKRSLYLLVVNSRETQEQNRIEYWLKIIQSFSGGSPILIVGNKIDQHPLDIDRTGLQKKYSNIVGILETSAATGAGIEELKAVITEQVNKLPHVRDLLPEAWFTVKTKLEELGLQSNFITHDKYIDLCTENEVSDETSQRTLIGFLHDLGVVLHFQDDRHLAELGILNPQWVTNGVYKILNDKSLFANKGVLTLALLDEILSAKAYPQNKRLFIVEMMRKFELCYDIDHDTFLIPDLLPKDEPQYQFNGIPAFEYAYPVLPSSVITRFIVRMNQKINDGFVWRTGVMLKIGENKALVKADIEDRKITIAIDGLEHTRRDALSAIRFQLDEIHASIKGLNPEKFVPIPGAESQRYDFLLQLEHDGVKVLPVPAKGGGKPIMLDVSQLLSGIESEAQRRENVTHVTTVYNITTGGGDFTGGDKSISAGTNSLVIGGNVSDSRISTSYNKIESSEINPELKQTLQSLTEAIAAVIQSFSEEKTIKVVKNFERLVEEVTQPEPDPQWYSVSVEGLIKAAENLDKLGKPIISLSRKVLSLLTGGTIH